MIVTATQLAEILGYSESAVRSWVRAGCPIAQEPAKATKGMANDDSRRSRLFDTSQVHSWLVNRARWY